MCSDCSVQYCYQGMTVILTSLLCSTPVAMWTYWSTLYRWSWVSDPIKIISENATCDFEHEMDDRDRECVCLSLALAVITVVEALIGLVCLWGHTLWREASGRWVVDADFKAGLPDKPLSSHDQQQMALQVKLSLFVCHKVVLSITIL